MLLEEGEAVNPIESWFYLPWISKFAERGGVREGLCCHISARTERYLSPFFSSFFFSLTKYNINVYGENRTIFFSWPAILAPAKKGLVLYYYILHTKRGRVKNNRSLKYITRFVLIFLY